MRLLLDTHALLWWSAGADALSSKAKRAIRSSDAEIYVSAASAWEIATKVRIGKLSWPATVSVTAYAIGQGFRQLPISLEHAERAGRLAMAHRDPFDRMLIAQAQIDDLMLVSNEAVFDTTGVPRLW